MMYNLDCKECNNERYLVVPSSWDDDIPMRVECEHCRVEDMLLNTLVGDASKLLVGASIERLAVIVADSLVSRYCIDKQMMAHLENLVHTKNINEILNVAGVYLAH